MRVTRTEDRTDDQGAVAITVAVALVMLFAASAFAVDLGMLWAARRGLVTATDAAALAAAREYAIDEDATQTGCDTDHAEALFADNAPGAVLTGCTVVVNGTSGYVTVTGERTVNFAIAPAIGVDTGTVPSTTTVRWGQTSIPGGLRPFGLCVESNQALVDWLALPVASRSDTDITIAYGKGSNTTTCGSSPGNWGVLDLNGGANSNSETQDWVLNGYDVDPPTNPPIFKGTPGLTCPPEPMADPVAESCVEGDTGSFSQSLATELAYLRDNDVEFALPLFDWVSTGPATSGGNADFHVVGFVLVELNSFMANGPEAARYLDLEFKSIGLGQGSCCDDSGIDGGVRTIQICGVEPNDTSHC